jgi:hypothetical protein
MSVKEKIGELRYGVNAMRALQEKIRKTPADILINGFDGRDMELGVSIIWAGMLWNNRALTVDEVGDILDSEEKLYVNALSEAVPKFLASFKRTLGLPDQTAQEEKGKN